jgi:carboxyl-terminal processing protease
MPGDQVGLINVASLEPGKVNEVASAVKSLEKQGAKRLVLDLRSNSVGRPEDGAALANLFVDNGLLTYLEGQKVERKNIQAEPAKVVTKLPLVVITNRGTAGAAEVAVSALLERKRAEVVGERTYGDAAIRRAVTMEDGSAVILSVAKYYSASGKALQDTGVTPTVLVTEAEPAFEEEDETNAPKKDAGDPVLKRAIEVAVKGPNVPSAAAAPSAPGAAADASEKERLEQKLPPTEIKKPKQ